MTILQLSLFEEIEEEDDDNFWKSFFGFNVELGTIGRMDEVICKMENNENCYCYCMEVEVIEIVGKNVRCVPTLEWLSKVPNQPLYVYTTELKNIAPIFNK